MPPLLNLLCRILLYLLVSLPVVLMLYPTIRRVIGEPYRRRDFLLCMLLTYLNIATNRPAATLFNGLNILTSLFFFFLIVRFVFHRKGIDCFFNMTKLVVVLSAEEAMCMLVFTLMSALGFDQSKLMVLELADFYRVENLFYSSLVNLLGMLPVYLCVVALDCLKNRKQPEMKPQFRKNLLFFRTILRVTLLVFTGLGMLAMPFTLYGDRSLIQYLIENNEQYVVLSICCVALMIIALSYLVQDIRYILQLQRLNTLEQQQAISRSLVANLRYFRHNMVNMLYGLEGVLISGDRERVTAYYNEMREKCALVNNENIAALERITNPSVSAVLLRAVDRAREMSLPVNLYVQEGVIFPHILSDTDLCQVLGVLTDNAIEAAHQAAERHVSVELRNVDGALEIIVRNTYAGEITPECLNLGGASTKEGHEGQGLKSCYHILGRKKGAFLNFWVTGQYVQAQLLLGR